MVTDPVCGMEIDEKKAAAKSEYKGQVYYFCIPNCKRWFEANPERYLTQARIRVQSPDRDKQREGKDKHG